MYALSFPCCTSLCLWLPLLIGHASMVVSLSPAPSYAAAFLNMYWPVAVLPFLYERKPARPLWSASAGEPSGFAVIHLPKKKIAAPLSAAAGAKILLSSCLPSPIFPASLLGRKISNCSFFACPAPSLPYCHIICIM